MMGEDRARNRAARRRRALKSVGMALILCVVAAVPAAAKRRKGSGHAKSRQTAVSTLRRKHACVRARPRARAQPPPSPHHPRIYPLRM